MSVWCTLCRAEAAILGHTHNILVIDGLPVFQRVLVKLEVKSYPIHRFVPMNLGCYDFSLTPQIPEGSQLTLTESRHPEIEKGQLVVHCHARQKSQRLEWFLKETPMV
jgi:hypothetical protein